MANPGKFPELCGKIREKFGTQQAFAEAIGMHPSTLSAKLNGRTQWAFVEVVDACRVLGIPLAEADPIFYG